MARTFIRQDAQIGSTLDTLIGFNDAVAPAAAMESGAGTVADDLNNLRSIASLLKDVQAGNWYDDLIVPSALETGVKRGVDTLNTGLHAVEKKRILRNVHSLVDVAVGAADNFVILGTGELPSPLTAAVGSVTTLGTVVATHGGTFGTHALDEVAGVSAIAPLNLMIIVDGATRDPILSGARKVYGLLQGESGVVDGSTITDTTTNRVQISFVRVNAAGDNLEAVPSTDIQGLTVNYTTRERVRLEDLNEADFLGGAIVDVPAGSTVTRQAGYDNQGTTPVNLTTNATLDLEGAGLAWSVRDDLEADLFKVTDGSAGGTSEVQIAAAADTFNVDAIVNDFASGISARTGGTRPIDIGVNDGLIESTAGVLEMKSADDLVLNDANMVAEATWAGPGVKVSDTTGEVSAYETAFGGEVSLMNALVQALNGSSRTRVDSTMTANAASGADINGPGTPHANMDVDLLPYDVAGIAVLEVFLNGELLRLTDDYTAGGTPADGDLQTTFNLKGNGAKPDQFTVIRNGAN